MPGIVIEKSAFEMSKKTFPTASTLMRAFFVGVFGTIDVLRAVVRRRRRQHVRVRVAAVDRQRDLHVAVEIGGAFVPATFQVTVCVEPAAHADWRSAVTRNGPVPGRERQRRVGVAAFVAAHVVTCRKRKSSRGGLAFVPAKPT